MRRVDPWLWAALSLLVGGCLPLAPWAVVVASLGVALLLLEHLTLRWLLVGLILVLVGGRRAQAELSAFEQRRVHVRDELGEPRRCAGQGVVVTQPVWANEAIRVDVEFESLDCEGRDIVGPVTARLYGGPLRLTRGAKVFVIAKLGALRLFRNFDVTDPTPYRTRQQVVLSGSALAVDLISPGGGYLAVIDRARTSVRERIFRTFAPAAEPMARALVLGENDLSEKDDEAFRQSGLSHLLAVSGTHLIFAVVTLVTALRALLLRLHWLATRVHVARIAAAAGIAMALLYADFSGGSGSAWRAAWMLVIVFGTKVCERKPNAARVVAFTVLAGALLNPLICFDLSFMLSLAATAGLLVIGRPLAARCKNLRFSALRYAAVSLVATFASMLPCAPLLAMMSPELTLAGLFANVLAAPIGELAALPVCLVHAIAAPLPLLETGLAAVGSGALLCVRQVALASASMQSLAFSVPDPSRWQLVVLGLAAAAGFADVVRHGSRWWCPWLWILGVLAALLLVDKALAEKPVFGAWLRVNVLDVGQGDSTLVQFPDHSAMLIDAGGFVGSPVDPGRRVILPWLRAQRIQELGVVTLSHPHPDHFGGLLAVVENVKVGEFWDTGQGRSEGAGPDYRALLEALERRRVPVLGPRELCGKVRHRAGVKLEVLAPCPSFVPRRNANDNSLVVKVSYGERSFLLTGDAEREQEQELVARYGAMLRSDVLKVGHHGSRTSTTLPFLQQVRPKFATISCGVRNRFGHPHARTMQTLSANGVLALRTDRFGALRFATDGERLELHSFAYPR